MGCFLATALILSYVEAVLPINFVLPGFKLGLANIVIMLTLKKYGFGYSLFINVTRIVIINLLFGNVFNLMVGLSGGMLSLLVMYLVSKSRRVGYLGLGMAGSVTHDIGQIVCIFFLFEIKTIFSVLPFFMILGLIMGIISGVCALIVNKIIQSALPDK